MSEPVDPRDSPDSSMQDIVKAIKTIQLLTPRQARRLHKLSTVIAGLEGTLSEVQQARKDYEKEVENAKGSEIFKYLLLMNSTELKEYITQARIQAE